MHKKILMEKMKEAAASVLPVTVIVLAVCLLLVPVESGLMLAFLIGSAMLIAGIGLFSLGAEMSMTRIGSLIGAKMTKSRKLGVILLVSFLLGAASASARIFRMLRIASIAMFSFSTSSGNSKAFS